MVDAELRKPAAHLARYRVILAILVLLGLALRLLPSWMDPGIALLDDAAYHERLVRETVSLGRLPAVDSLSEAPEGRRLREHLPVGMYGAAAAFHRLLEPLDHGSVRSHVMLFIALAGALIAFPVYSATRAAGGDPRAALIAAAIAEFIPAHLHRTFGHWVRYDAIGTLLVVTHLAFALRALRADGGRPRYADTLASAASLVAAAAVWRVALLVPFLECLFVLLVICPSGVDRPVRRLFIVVAAAGTLAFALMDPMRTQGFTRSGAWLLVMATALACSLPSVGAGVRPAVRIATAAAAVAVALLAVRAVGVSGAYDAAFDTATIKLRLLLHLGAPSGPLANLMLDVIELYGLTPLALLIGPQQLLALGPWCLAAPVLIARRRGIGWRDLTRAAGSPGSLLAFMCGAWALLTLLFERNKVVLGPLVAIVCGVLATHLWPLATSRGDAPRAARADGRRPRPGRGGFTSRPSPILGALLGASIVATMVCGVVLAQSRRSRHDPARLEAAAFLRQHGSPGSVVAAPWWFGYELQALAARPTVTDGLLESAENRRRILTLFAALLDPEPGTLLRFCRRYRADYLLVSSEDLIHVAWVADPALADHLSRGRALTPEEQRLTLVRLLMNTPVPGFVPVFERRRLRIFAVSAPSDS